MSSTDGDGDILRITGEPHPGSRTIDMDSYNWTVTDEHMLTYPSPYTIEYYGYKPGVVALSFDDGPDPNVDAQDPGHSQTRKGVQSDLHDDRRTGTGQCEPDEAGDGRGTRDRQSHLDPSRHQRDLSRPGASCS